MSEERKPNHLTNLPAVAEIENQFGCNFDEIDSLFKMDFTLVLMGVIRRRDWWDDWPPKFEEFNSWEDLEDSKLHIPKIYKLLREISNKEDVLALLKAMVNSL